MTETAPDRVLPEWDVSEAISLGLDSMPAQLLTQSIVAEIDGARPSSTTVAAVDASIDGSIDGSINGSMDGAMAGYDRTSYGEAFADVYDDWYGDISDVDATVRLLVGLSLMAGADLPIVELGVGTGRLAVPLAACVHPTPVIGIDSSTAMLERLAAKQADPPLVTPVLGDMIADLPDGPLGVVFVAFNTFFNLGTAARQQACFHAVAARLAPSGSFVIEAYVPDDPPRSGSHVDVKSIATDRVVLSVARYDGESSRAEGQFVEFTEAGGVRLRPWSIRFATPAELDMMATSAGLDIRNRWEDASRVPFDQDSDRHVSIYGRG